MTSFIRCVDVTNRSVCAALALLAVAAVPIQSGSDGWSGTWKLDRSRSALVGTSFRIRRVSNGYHFDFGAVNFDIGDDGAFYPTIPGRLTSIKKTSDHEWTRVHRENGADVDRSILRITPDNQTLIIDTDTVTPGQGVKHSEETDQRVGVGQGLAGTWRSIEKGINVAEIIRLQQLPDGKIHWETPSDGNYFVVEPNGPAAANQGPRSVSNATMSLDRISPVEMHWTVRLAGKPFMQRVDTLESNGHLVETSWPDQIPDERQRAVYARND
jgi:hypothetical protein